MHETSPVPDEPQRPRFAFLLQLAGRRLALAIDAVGQTNSAARRGMLLAIRPGDDGSPLAEVGRALQIAPSALTGLVDRAVARGLVRRVADPADGRACRVVLSERGAIERIAAKDAAHALDAQLREGFSDAELAVVARWLTAVTDTFAKEPT